MVYSFTAAATVWLKQRRQRHGIFGFYIRQEQTETSDVDVLVEFSKTPSLLTFINLENYPSDNLEVKVDLGHKAGFKLRIGDRILEEVVYL